MCAARVEVLIDQVLVKHKNVTIGKGRGVYELRDFDPQIDVLSIHSELTRSISWLILDLEEHLGRAVIRTREHDTTIDIEVPRPAMVIGRSSLETNGGIILDETYGYGPPNAVPIIDSNKNILAIITHQPSSAPYVT